MDVMKLPSEAPKEHGWDGYDAPPTSKAAIKTAEILTQWIPTSDGGLYLDGRAGGAEVTIDINADGVVTGVSFERVE
jgi:hypothetical protein